MLQNRKVVLPLGIILAFVALAAAVVMVRASADDMLYAAARLLSESTTGHAVVSFTAETPEESASGTAEVWGKLEAGPNGEPAFRIEVLEASKGEAVGMVAVSDGTQLWLWQPAENTVYVGTAEELKNEMAQRHSDEAAGPEHSYDGEMPETPEEAVDMLLEYFTAERAGAEAVAGMRTEKLRLIPIPEQMPDELRANGGFINVWLRNSDSAPLAAEYAEGAMGYAKATATSLELNVDIDDSVFTFAIPEGAKVVRLADLAPESVTLDEAAATAEFPVLTPAELPADAQLVEVLEMRGAVVQRYALADGGRFTVAQGADNAAETPEDEGQPVSVRGVEGMLYASEDGSRTLLSWSEGDVTFWIGGDVTPDAALAIAQSLQ